MVLSLVLKVFVAWRRAFLLFPTRRPLNVVSLFHADSLNRFAVPAWLISDVVLFKNNSDLFFFFLFLLIPFSFPKLFSIKTVNEKWGVL